MKLHRSLPRKSIKTITQIYNFKLSDSQAPYMTKDDSVDLIHGVNNALEVITDLHEKYFNESFPLLAKNCKHNKTYRIAFTLQEIDMGLYNTFVKAKTMKNALYNPSIYEGVYYPITEHRNYIYSNEERTAKFKQYIYQNGYKNEGAYFLEYLQKLTDIEFTLAKEFFNKESASGSINYTGLDDSLNSFFLDEEFKRFLDNYFRENEWYVLPF